MKFLTIRFEFFLGFLICLLAILFALYLEFFKGLEPCPLCILQRAAFISAGFFYLIASLHGPKLGPQKWAGKIYGILVLVCIFLGLFIAMKQIYIQHLPKDQVPSCGPGLEYLRQTLPWNKFLETLFQGDGECAVIGHRFVFLSLSEWTALVFALLSLLNIRLVCRVFLFPGKKGKT